MASSRGNVHSDTAKKEQIITEFFNKTLQIILDSRSSYVSSRNYSGEQAVSSPSSSSSSSSSVRTRDKWFNLRLRECPAALENIDFLRQSNLEPMVVDVILVQRSVGWDPVNFSPQRDYAKNPTLKEQVPNFLNSEPEDFGVEPRKEKVIERWVVQYESRKSRDGVGSTKSSGNLHSLYKKSIVLLRSLYVTLRLLPAYKLFRELISSGQIRTCSLTHRVSSFVEPFTRREEADMQRYSFAPVETSCGRICLSVSYRSILSDVILEPSTPLSLQFISDYVGSPLADPLRRFPSLPRSHGSLSCSPFGRCHSWSYENYRASSPCSMPSPSPTYSDSYASQSKFKSRLTPPLSLPQHVPEPFQATAKDINYDEYWSSPVYSPSTFKQDRSTGSSGSSVEKFSRGRNGSGRYCGVRMSANRSPGISCSRSSSRPLIQDDLDDTEFACPFVVDDDDILGSRPGPFDQKGQPNDPLEHGRSVPVRKSQDAAVGALVLMLKKAPPLRPDSLVASKSVSCQNNEESVLKPDDLQSQKGPASTSIMSSSPQTTADALEELRSFKELKALLLSQGNNTDDFRDTSTEGPEREKP